MDNTKFTKGKWVANYQAGSWLIQDKETYQDGLKGCLAEVYYFDDAIDTAEHNALLISKAPEMLEMLGECKKSFLDYSPSLEQIELIDKIEQLIKQATEL